MCTVIFADGISLDRWGFAHVEGQAITDRRLQRKARRAVDCCPRGALALVPVLVTAPTVAPSNQTE